MRQKGKKAIYGSRPSTIVVIGIIVGLITVNENLYSPEMVAIKIKNK